MAEYLVTTENGQYRVTTEDQPGPKGDAGSFTKNLKRSLGDFSKASVDAIAHPVGTASNLLQVGAGAIEKPVRAGLQLIGGKPISKSPEEQKFDAVVGSYGQRYGSFPQALKTAYEDPIGTLADASTVLGSGAGVAKAAGMSKTAGLAGILAKATNPASGGKQISAPPPPPKSAGAFESMAIRKYQSALKPSTAQSRADVEKIVKTGLKEGVPVSDSGLAQVRSEIDRINEMVKERIAQGAMEGKAVDPEKVAAYADRSKAEFALQTDPGSDLATIEGVRGRFLDRHSKDAPYTKVKPAVEDGSGYIPVGKGVTKVPQPIPVDEAQALKQGEYRKLKDAAYGELKGSEKEARKDLARGLKDGIYEHFPELKQIGKREGSLIELERALERFANRVGNKDLGGIGTPIKGTAASAVTGSPEIGFGYALLTSALEKPEIKSRLAIALYRHRNKAAKAQSAGLKAAESASPAVTAGTRVNEHLSNQQQ